MVRAQDSAARPGGWRTLAAWLAPARAAIATSLAVLVAAKLAAVAAPVVYKYAVDALVAPGVLPGERMLALGALGLICAYAAARLMAVGFERLQEVLCARVSRKVVRQWARDAMPHIFHLPARFHEAQQADMVSRTVQRAIAAMEFLLRALMVHAVPFILELGLVAGALWLVLDWRYALLVAGASALYLAAAAVLAAADSETARRYEHERAAERRLEDGLAGLDIVQQFGAEQREAEAYQRQRSPAVPKGQRARSFALAFMRAALWHIGFLACLAWTVRDVSQGVVSLGGLVMVHAFWMQMMLSMEGRRLDVRVICRARADLDAMAAILQKTPSVVEMPHAPALIVRAGDVAFDRVSFGYDGGAAGLHNISFAVARGQKTGIVGGFGAGKSTIGRLLLRAHDVQEGRITIDGQDVREVSRASLRAAMGIIRNKNFLFRATVHQNIAYARPSASKADVVAAAKAAGCHERFLAMPNGYETILDNRVRLRLGDDRRIAMARIALQDPPILLLDEADFNDIAPQQREAQKAMQALCVGRTLVVMTHWLSAITDADHIILLKEGKMFEQGTHQSLLALDGEYAQRWYRHTQLVESFRMRQKFRAQ